MNDPLIGWWAGTFSRPMYDDGVITYSATGYYRKVFNRLEKDTGIDFQRVKADAEITCLWEDPHMPGAVGLASSDTPGKWTLRTMPKKEYKYAPSTAAHEIGHSLGLQHNHELDTIMSYNRNKSQVTYFTPLDIAAIETVFGVF